MYGKRWDYFPTLGIVFAFDSTNLKELLDFLGEFSKEKNLSIEHQIDLVCILKKGLIVYFNVEKNWISFPPEPGCQLVIREGKPGESLSLFYRATMRIFTQLWTRPIRILDYFKG